MGNENEQISGFDDPDKRNYASFLKRLGANRSNPTTDAERLNTFFGDLFEAMPASELANTNIQGGANRATATFLSLEAVAAFEARLKTLSGDATLGKMVKVFGDLAPAIADYADHYIGAKLSPSNPDRPRAMEENKAIIAAKFADVFPGQETDHTRKRFFDDLHKACDNALAQAQGKSK